MFAVCMRAPEQIRPCHIQICVHAPPTHPPSQYLLPCVSPFQRTACSQCSLPNPDTNQICSHMPHSSMYVEYNTYLQRWCYSTHAPACRPSLTLTRCRSSAAGPTNALNALDVVVRGHGLLLAPLTTLDWSTGTLDLLHLYFLITCVLDHISVRVV